MYLIQGDPLNPMALPFPSHNPSLSLLNPKTNPTQTLLNPIPTLIYPLNSLNPKFSSKIDPSNP